MWQLVKRDFFLFKWIFLFAFVFRFIIGMFPIIDSANIYFMSFMTIATYAFIFLQDSQSKVIQTVVSLPVKKTSIVISRYISLFIFALIYLGINFLVDTVIEQHTFHLIIVYFILIALTLIIAITTPIYYLFRSVWISLIVQYGVTMVGVLSTVFFFADPFDWFAPFIISFFHFIELQPFVIISGFLLLIMALSVSLSLFLFKKKDLV